MRKTLLLVLITLTLLLGLTVNSLAATEYTVVKGDTMWRIAVKHQVGISELKAANPQIVNPDLIYPGQILAVPTKDGTATGFEGEVVRLVNIEREKAGLGPLVPNWELARVARYKSEDMKNKGYFSHTSPTYGSPFQMMRSFGISFRSAGENIARGQTTPAAVVKAWMSSNGHRANILNPSFTHIGVGYVQSGHYWTQMFISE